MARGGPISTVLPGLGALSATLRRYAHELPPDELPALVGALEGAKALAWIRLQAAQHNPQEQPSAAGTGNLLDATAMAERLKVPESWLRDAARRGRVPCVYVGRYPRFDPVMVLRAITAHGRDHAA